MTTEAALRADFQTILRYGQCWEDADILLDALAIQPNDHCLSIGSAGDNALAMLTRDPASVIAVDMNPAQTAAIALRMEAYRQLSYPELLMLMGSRPSQDRWSLYQRCRPGIEAQHRAFWDDKISDVNAYGIGGAGKFEHYFRLFATRIVPLVHRRKTIDALLAPRDKTARLTFYDQHWNSWRWRLMFRVFFSRLVMGKLGRDPALFTYVQGSVAQRILERTRHALTVLPPDQNPYLHWILKGNHGQALPLALREAHFQTIRQRLDRVTIVQGTLESALTAASRHQLHRFNLSDIFEYMSDENTGMLLERLLAAAAPGARLAYWNMLVPRSRPEQMADRLKPVQPLADELFGQDKAFFYSRFVIEEVVG